MCPNLIFEDKSSSSAAQSSSPSSAQQLILEREETLEDIESLEDVDVDLDIDLQSEGVHSCSQLTQLANIAYYITTSKAYMMKKSEIACILGALFIWYKVTLVWVSNIKMP